MDITDLTAGLYRVDIVAFDSDPIFSGWITIKDDFSVTSDMNLDNCNVKFGCGFSTRMLCSENMDLHGEYDQNLHCFHLNSIKHSTNSNTTPHEKILHLCYINTKNDHLEFRDENNPELYLIIKDKPDCSKFEL